MPTLRGWTGLALGVACIIAGRILGLQELYIVGGVLLALVIAAIIIAVMRPLSLAVARSCLLYTSPSPRDRTRSRMPSSA